jgi:protein O-GlcNAc transferase
METNAVSDLVSRWLSRLDEDPVQARAHFERILIDRPADPAANYGMGLADLLLGNPAAAIQRFQNALGSRHWRGYAFVGIGDSLVQLGKPDEALKEYARATASLRETPNVALRIAACSLGVGRVVEAAGILRRQYRRNPRNRYAAALLARCYSVMNRYEQARLLADSVLREEPSQSEALKAACMAVSAMGDIEATLTHSRRLLDVQPSQTNAAHYLYHLLLSSTAADRVDAEYLRVQGHFTPAEVVPRVPAVRCSTGRMRVGYVSGLFGGHQECFLPLFRHHDRTRFEIHAFADPGQRSADGKARLAQFCEQWHEIGGLSNPEVAARVREAGIDVLVDCDGLFQSGQRLGLYPYRPAPVQISFLYPHRTGVAAIDYQIGDPWLFPDDVNRSSERVVRLPLFACHEAPPNDIPVSELPARRNGYITFGSFSPPIKINEAVVEAWARILKRVPRSRLILHSKMGPRGGDPYPDIRRRFLRLFAAHGVSRGRVTLVGNRDLKAHMAIYHEIDLALDPWPHNGMRTTFMALWMGVPVLTKAGDAMVSRMGLSLVTEAGLADWVAPDVEAYVEQACRRCEDLDALADIRRGLREQVRRSRLMDGERFARSMEAAFEQMLMESGCGERSYECHA